MANPLYLRDIISINDLSRDELELVLNTAAALKQRPQPELLKHKVIASCFFEASTRTRLSFETAIQRLGASVVGFSDSSNTSLGKKGETLADTMSVISQYADAIVMRHPQEGAARLVSEFSGKVPVINAGDGANQHPTQTLLDLFTIQETQGRLENLHIAMVGDLNTAALYIRCHRHCQNSAATTCILLPRRHWQCRITSCICWMKTAWRTANIILLMRYFRSWMCCI